MRLPVTSQKRNQDKQGYFDYVPYNENQINNNSQSNQRNKSQGASQISSSPSSAQENAGDQVAVDCSLNLIARERTIEERSTSGPRKHRIIFDTVENCSKRPVGS